MLQSMGLQSQTRLKRLSSSSDTQVKGQNLRLSKQHNHTKSQKTGNNPFFSYYCVSDNQYLFLPPNRYIFHGAEVYSDSEDDVLSSSSCGSNSDSGTCQSPSLEEPMEDESENEEFYNGLEDDADINERAGGTVFEADGGDQEAVNEAISVKQEATCINYPSNKS